MEEHTVVDRVCVCVCVFTLMSMGRVSVGQSSLRRAFPAWLMVQYPVIFTSGRGNLGGEGHMVTAAGRQREHHGGVNMSRSASRVCDVVSDSPC